MSATALHYDMWCLVVKDDLDIFSAFVLGEFVFEFMGTNAAVFPDLL
jgi:hypothetical protein